MTTICRMEIKESANSKSGYAVTKNRLRAQILKYLHSRHVLILGCVLVVLECMCIMAELMVDLQGIRIRFENEENEVKQFVDFMKSQNPEAFREFDGKTLEEILIVLKETTILWNPKRDTVCDCHCDSVKKFNVTKVEQRKRRALKNGAMQTESKLAHNKHKSEENILFAKTTYSLYQTSQQNSSFKNYYINNYYNKTDFQSPKFVQRKMKLNSSSDSVIYAKPLFPSDNKLDILQNYKDVTKFMQASNYGRNHSLSLSVQKERTRRAVASNNTPTEKAIQDVFVFTVNLDEENFHIVSNFKELSDTKISMSALEDEITKTSYYEQYQRIHDISLGIKYAGFGILTLMLAETLLKFVCTGLGFFKKKFEVFDAFIVISSFILDVIFLDSRWYETGKDATTILVLLLPWRVVRIVNNFLMTINHKHYIEIMTIKKAKKRGEIKLKKIQGLLVEIRRDIDLLINLCKTKGATENEISACIYGKGRRTTLAAITSFASLMFISTLGKDPSTGHVFDDVYGDLIQDVLEDDAGTDKGNSEDTMEKADDFDTESNGETESVASRKKSTGKRSSIKQWTKEKRRATLPRRQGSRKTESEDVYYINDGYVASDEVKGRSSSLYNKSNVRSLPMITRPSSNYVTFEVTTQVTYL